MDAPYPRCPDCGTPLTVAGHAFCPRCRLPLTGPEAAELRDVHHALTDLGLRRAALLRRRGDLLVRLRAQRPGAAAWQTAAPWHPATLYGPPRKDAKALSAQTVLLVLGGSLIVVAGLVFTLVSWGRLGLGGRAAVLALLTALALTAYLPLRRRSLKATAETSSAVGLALVLLDCYAARGSGLAGLQHIGGAAYWAVVTGLVAAGAAVYGRAIRSAVVPFAALLLVQCTAPLAALAASAGPAGWATALAAAAGFDLAAAIALRHRAGALALAGRTAASAWAVLGGAVAATAAFQATGYGEALRPCGPLLLLVLLGLAATLRRELPYGNRLGGAVLAGLALTTATAAAPRVALPGSWSVLAAALPATALTVAALTCLSAGVRDRVLWTGLAASGGAVLALAALTVLADLLRALAEPVLRAAGVSFTGGWQVAPAIPGVAALVAAALGAAAPLLGRVMEAGTTEPGGTPTTGVTAGPGPAPRPEGTADPGPAPQPGATRPGGIRPGTPRPALIRTLLRCGALTAALIALALAPVAAGLPYAVALAAAWLPACGAAVHIVRRPAAARAPGLCVLVGSTALALLWSLPEDAAALSVWGASALLAAGLATALRRSGSEPVIAAVAAGFTVAALGIEAARAEIAAGLPAHVAAFAVLGVALLTVPTAAALRSLTVELAGYDVAAVALLMTVDHPDALSVTLAVAGVGALGVALRADRRRAAALTATALLTAASWVRLALAGVAAPEPYTLTVSAAVLLLGHLRRRRVPATGSWAAYGAGLAFSLLPGLIAAWNDTHWPRPLLLGLTALAVTLVGARHRLQAPLLTGGAVLLADALHELAPAIAQSLGALPRWAPLAAAGLLLVFVGATYERRLADGRRLREGLRRMR
ncbi:SCO7613 C-terminal domain-containing membrane protein [Streptomyces polygonati]|uniref:SCO7613 C-terminal domain-containing membrane protein n=1 Tax=Streptomyces polygonati TaxID=1617087 RepID=A0ABV8HNE4_9ACTN